MSERFDAAAWSGIERRLAAVERFIPDAPLWRPETGPRETHGAVRLGPAFGQRTTTTRALPGRLVLALVVVGLALAVIAAALLAGSRRPEPGLEHGPYGAYGLFRQQDGGANAALLPDGRVLIVSGEWLGPDGTAIARADIWARPRSRVSPELTRR